MILAQNLRLRLNGSKYIALILLCLFTFSACSTSKSVSKKSRTSKPTRSTQAKKPRTKKKVKVDTVKWTGYDYEASSTSPGESSMIKKNRYNIAMFMPFKIRGSEGADISDKSTRINGFLNYYAGVKMALEKLESEGINLHLEVHDSESRNLPTKLRSASKSVDLIIGPYSMSDIKTAAKLGRENDLTVVSPWKATSKIKDNPYYVQLLPNLNDHFDKIVEHAGKRYKEENIVLVGREGNSKDQNIINYLQTTHRKMKGARAKDLMEYYVPVDSLLNGESAFDDVFVKGETTAFIIPNYSSKDEQYLHNCLRRINVEKGTNKVTVYTMPLAFNSDLVTFDYYKNLDMKIARSYYVDPSEVRVQQFRRDFFDVYHATPTDDAFKGYDMMLFIGRALYNYGSEFQFHIGKDDQRYLQTGYSIHRKSDSEDGEYDRVDYFMNHHLDILEFKNNQFTRK